MSTAHTLTTLRCLPPCAAPFPPMQAFCELMAMLLVTHCAGLLTSTFTQAC